MPQKKNGLVKFQATYKHVDDTHGFRREFMCENIDKGVERALSEAKSDQSLKGCYLESVVGSDGTLWF